MKHRLVMLAAVILFVHVNHALSEGPLAPDEGILVDRFPYAVSLTDASGKHKCGGVLVDIRWILTAAQCVSPLVDNSIPEEELTIKFGGSNARAAVEIMPIQTIIHPLFDGNPKNGFDIALIYFQDPSQQVPLYTSQMARKLNKDGQAFNLGWETGETSSIKLKVSPVSSVTLETCSSSVNGWNGSMECSMLCVSFLSAGFCGGKAGSPLILADSPSNLHKGNFSLDTLAGIFSFGEGKCTKNNRPTAFTRVFSFLEWINETIDSFETGEQVFDGEASKSSTSQTNPLCKSSSTTVITQPISLASFPPEQEASSSADKVIHHECISGCKKLNKKLFKAAEAGQTTMTKRLLKKGANPDSQGRYRETPLHKAAEGRHLNVIKILLDAGAQVDVQNALGWTALFEASRYDYPDVVSLLLDAGAQVDLQDTWGFTALMRASRYGHAEIVGLLLDAGAEVDDWNHNRDTPLIHASSRGRADVVRLLLDAGAKVNVQNEIDGDTALMEASFWGHDDVLRLLLDAGAEVDAQNDYDGYTALMYASSRGHSEAVRLLLDAGAQVNIPSHVGYTALMKASSEGYADIVRMLLDVGAQIDAQDKDGYTSLMRASENDYPDIVHLLLDAGASTTLRNSKGKTADDLAQQRNGTDKTASSYYRWMITLGLSCTCFYAIWIIL